MTFDDARTALIDLAETFGRVGYVVDGVFTVYFE